VDGRRLARVDWGLPLRALVLFVERRRSRRWWRRDEGRAEGVSDVYRGLAARHGVREARRQVFRMRRRGLRPRAWLDAVVATFLLRWARGDHARVRNVLAFVAVYYDPTDLDRGVARAARRLRVLERAGRPLPAPARALLEARDWATVERRAREALPPEPPAPPPGRPPPAPRGGVPRSEPVVLRLTGGLGNQLFQYVAARGYADRVGADLLFDLDHYERPRAPRELLLPRFRVEVRRAGFWDVARAMRRPHREPPVTPDAALLEGKPGLRFLAGYWEDAAYLAGLESSVREWFRPKDAALEASARAFARERKPSRGSLVALHVRRGDRVLGRPDSSPHRALPVEYFRRAIAEFPAGSRFLVFSDSPEDVAWCRENLGLGAESVACAPAVDPVFDLVAMAACDHFVISASTFSWWAAWLCESPGKVVVAPDPMFATGPLRADVVRSFPVLPSWRVVSFPPPDRGRLRGARAT
jgi:hypothetical protein